MYHRDRSDCALHSYNADSRGHWVCTTTVGSPGEVKLCDSIGNYTAIDTSLLLQISNVYSAGGHCPILKVQRLNVQQQTGGSDCGCFAVAFATEICQGRNPCDACFDQDQMRVHLYKCLQQAELTAFPRSSVVETVPRLTTQLFTYTINCYCGMNDEYDPDMIQCDKCNGWVHFSCAGILQTSAEFTCSICLGEGRRVVGKPKQYSKFPAKKKNKC